MEPNNNQPIETVGGLAENSAPEKKSTRIWRAVWLVLLTVSLFVFVSLVSYVVATYHSLSMQELVFATVTFEFGVLVLPVSTFLISIFGLMITSKSLKSKVKRMLFASVVVGLLFLAISTALAFWLGGSYLYYLGLGGLNTLLYAVIMTGTPFFIILFLIGVILGPYLILRGFKIKKSGLFSALFTFVIILLFAVGGYFPYKQGLDKTAANSAVTHSIVLTADPKTEIDRLSNGLIDGLIIRLDTKSNKDFVSYSNMTIDVEINGKTTSYVQQIPQDYKKGDSKTFEVEVSALDLVKEVSQNGDYKIGKITIKVDVPDDFYGSITQVSDSKALNMAGNLDPKTLNDTDFTFKLDQSSVNNTDKITKTPARLYGVLTSNRFTPGAIQLSTDGGNTWPYSTWGPYQPLEFKQTSPGMFEWSASFPVQDTVLPNGDYLPDYMVKARLVNGQGVVIPLNKFATNKSLNFGVQLTK